MKGKGGERKTTDHEEGKLDSDGEIKEKKKEGRMQPKLGRTCFEPQGEKRRKKKRPAGMSAEIQNRRNLLRE